MEKSILSHRNNKNKNNQENNVLIFALWDFIPLICFYEKIDTEEIANSNWEYYYRNRYRNRISNRSMTELFCEDSKRQDVKYSRKKVRHSCSTVFEIRLDSFDLADPQNWTNIQKL